MYFLPSVQSEYSETKGTHAPSLASSPTVEFLATNYKKYISYKDYNSNIFKTTLLKFK